MVFWFFLLLFFFFKINKSIDIDECEINYGGCHSNAICTNTPGNYECKCKPGYIGNGTECSPCDENGYSFNETTCLFCPQNSTSLFASSSILDCKCDSFNHYPDHQTSTCLLCPLGFLLDDDSNTCQSKFFFFSRWTTFLSILFYLLFLEINNKLNQINK